MSSSSLSEGFDRFRETGEMGAIIPEGKGVMDNTSDDGREGRLVCNKYRTHQPCTLKRVVVHCSAVPAVWSELVVPPVAGDVIARHVNRSAIFA
jgi:hypothetical protein